MTDKMCVYSYPVDHDNQVRQTHALDGQIIITVEAGGRGIQIKLSPKVAAELAVNIGETVQDILGPAACQGLVSPSRAVTVVGYDPDGRPRVYIHKELALQMTIAELREQLRAAGVAPETAEIILADWQTFLANAAGPVGHA